METARKRQNRPRITKITAVFRIPAPFLINRHYPTPQRQDRWISEPPKYPKKPTKSLNLFTNGKPDYIIFLFLSASVFNTKKGQTGIS